MQSASSRYAPPAFTLHEAAAALGVSFDTLLRQLRSGQVRAERLEQPQGCMWRVYPHESQDPTQGAPSTLEQPPADVLRAEAMATYMRSLLEPLVAHLAEQQAVIRTRPRS
jgi:hypothetical protein